RSDKSSSSWNGILAATVVQEVAALRCALLREKLQDVVRPHRRRFGDLHACPTDVHTEATLAHSAHAEPDPYHYGPLRPRGAEDTQPNAYAAPLAVLGSCLTGHLRGNAVGRSLPHQNCRFLSRLVKTCNL